MPVGLSAGRVASPARPADRAGAAARARVVVLLALVAALVTVLALLLTTRQPVGAASVVLAAMVVLTELRPTDLRRRHQPVGIDARRSAPAGVGFLVTLTATAPLSLALLSCGLPLLVRAARRETSPVRVALGAGRAVAVVLVAHVVLAVLLPPPAGGGALVSDEEQWPAVVAAGVAAVAVDLLLRTAAAVGSGTAGDRPASRAERLRPAVVGLVLVLTAPALTIAVHGGVLLLLAVSLPVLLVRLGAFVPRRAGRRVLSDSLTGLPNREWLQSCLEDVLTAAGADGPGPGLLVLDLDHFKDVNDALGHPVGDAALQEVAHRLRSLPGPRACVARLGGDEFALVVHDGARAEELADVVVEVMSRPLRLGGRQVLLPVSVGVALAPEHGRSATALLRSADIALYQAKEVRGRACLYAGRRGEEGGERVRLLGDLVRAVDTAQLRVAYQPQVDPATGALLGVEALVRWEHPELGPVAPDRFIPLAEQSGLIRRVTEVVLETALGDVAAWRAAGFRGVTVAVNVSARLLGEEDLPRLVTAALDRHGVDAGALVLEVTETFVVADPERARAVVRDLRALGCAVAVDDYGTGHSSLAYLTGLQVDELKIDRCFVTGMVQDRALAVIVRSTVAMSRDLGLRVVAEGVEDVATQRALADVGCHAVQGRHVGEPTTAAGVLARLRAPRPAGAVPTAPAAPAPRGALPAER